MLNVAVDPKQWLARAAYLSAAPRICTLANAANPGPRSHICGFIDAAGRAGVDFRSHIVGNHLPPSWTGSSSHGRPSGRVRALGNDLIRCWLAADHARRAWRRLGDRVGWVYERYASFASLGRRFQRAGYPWVLETNALLHYEMSVERRSMVLTSLARRRELAAYHACDLLVAVSEALADLLVAEGVARRRILVLPNGVDTERFDPTVYPPRPTSGRLVVGYVGTMIDRQGLDLLLHAISQVRHEGLDVGAELVGDGPAEPGLRGLSEKLGVCHAVHFAGPLPWEEVPAKIATYDVCYSGQMQLPLGVMYHSPLKLYEYMAMARPPICSAFADAKANVVDGRNGWLFPPGNAEGLTSCLRAACAARSHLPAMGADCRQHVVRDHSWDTRLARLLERVRGLRG